MRPSNPVKVIKSNNRMSRQCPGKAMSRNVPTRPGHSNALIFNRKAMSRQAMSRQKSGHSKVLILNEKAMSQCPAPIGAIAIRDIAYPPGGFGAERKKKPIIPWKDFTTLEGDAEVSHG